MGQNDALDMHSCKRAIKDFLGKGEFNNANEYCHRILDLYPADSETYILKLCAEVGVRGRDRLVDADTRFVSRSTYKAFLRYASSQEKDELVGYDLKIQERLTQEQKELTERKKRKTIRGGILVALCIITLESVFFIKEILAVKKVDKLIDQEEYQFAKEAIGDVKFYKTVTLSEYIDAKMLFEKKDYERARTKFEELSGFRDADVLKLFCDYYIAISRGDLDAAGIALSALQTKATEETSINQDELVAILDSKESELKFYSYYNEKKYEECRVFLQAWKSENPDTEDEFVRKNQSTWYEKAVSLITNVDENIDSRISDAEKLLNLCSIEYSDVSTYLDIYKAYHDRNLDVLFEYVENYPLAESLLFFDDIPSQWLVGRWESRAGEVFFDCSYDGEFFYSTYNLPCDWEESSKTNSYVDHDGIYYIFDKEDGTLPPDSRKSAFKIHIKGAGDIQMLCYKGNVNWRLIKQ